MCNARNYVKCTKKQSIKINTQTKYEIRVSAININVNVIEHKHKHNRTNERLDSPLGDVNDIHVGVDIIVETVWRMEILMDGNQIWWLVV
jgi:hypothetical protein